ncbi:MULTISPECIES: RNA polymerase sigma factor [unclassified Leeuwenhoekiella]|uniref:RNA polymerase sigma factor n=1 Tax=unclassified Leeuwenhoekiella TaxID=2615029 RepID=UPI000C44A293|nr:MULTISPECIES: RNA polymerase sigma-70 factor [unclassified Leeuwenhoekiella]MAW95405.1 RNA polymerase sigma-70 factor [Leeuwenhoekiella sp.]MBA80792.1 RNA polymerase sigma-70 factor [Leeuwenhoekiella sp.]|tara:strand:+ start:25949 stop:26557 length:609 start_codon:yes stop_codon:yes gene_type:complete
MKEEAQILYENEAVLVTDLRKGEESAYVYLMDSYHHKLCLYAYSFCKDRSLAADMVQNVLLRLWKKRTSLKINSSLRSFLYRSVYNEFLDQYKHRKFILNLEKEYMTAVNTLLDEEESNLDRLIHQVKKEIENLNPRCKEIFLLSKHEGLTNLEIAEHLNLSVKTVENQMTRAYSQLREKVGEKLQSILFLLFGISKKTETA